MVPHSATVIALRGNGPVRLAPGTRLNGIFEIDGFIAAGGMAEVYRAHTVETGDRVAIKVIKPDIAQDRSLMGLLRKEAATLSKIAHDAVVRYFLFSVDPDLACPYLVMELVEGPSLADFLKDGPLSLASVRVLQERIGAGLDAVHRLGITHRDISPDNIILPRSDPGKAKLIDFGIARSSFGDGTIIAQRFAGKLNFASPEHVGLHGGVVTPKSDVYAFGLTLAAALLGAPLDMGGTQLNMVRRRQSVPDLSGIDPKIRGVIARMLQPDPDDRPDMVADPAAAGPARSSGSADAPGSRRRW
ncbi:serine/threonine-protein kinase, partial [Methylobacterium trifolii]